MGIFSINSIINELKISDEDKKKKDESLVPDNDDNPIIPDDNISTENNEPILPDENNDDNPILPDNEEDSSSNNPDISNEDPVIPEDSDNGDNTDEPLVPEDDNNSDNIDDEPLLPDEENDNNNLSSNGEDNDNREDISNDNNQDETIKQLEEEIFANLDTEDIAIKNKELKSNFLKLFDTTSSIIDRINNICRTEQNTAILNFSATKITELRTMILDYMTDVYSRKSYMENAIMFNQYLAVLSGIKQLLDQIPLPENA